MGQHMDGDVPVTASCVGGMPGSMWVDLQDQFAGSSTGTLRTHRGQIRSKVEIHRVGIIG